MHEGTWTMRPCPRSEVRELAKALGVGDATAAVLVRRGYGDPRRHGPSWPPSRPGTIRFCWVAWRRPARYPVDDRAGGRICVHGDYDVDGICATALADRPADLGADVGWHLPSRFEEGYGVSRTP